MRGDGSSKFHSNTENNKTYWEYRHLWREFMTRHDWWWIKITYTHQLTTVLKESAKEITLTYCDKSESEVNECPAVQFNTSLKKYNHQTSYDCIDSETVKFL